MTTKTLLNSQWSFVKLPLPGDEIPPIPEKERFAPVDLPHDFCIYKTEDFYKNACGYYRMVLRRSQLKQDTRKALLCFDGVYMDSTLFVNGIQAGEWKYGYSAFSFDVYDLLTQEENEIIMRVCFRSPNSRWYSGGGIYRDVYLTEQGEYAIVPDGTYIHTEKTGKGWKLQIRCECNGDQVHVHVLDADARWDVHDGIAQGEILLPASAPVWDIEHPIMIDVSLSLLKGGEVCDHQVIKTGLRTIEYTCDRGFFLNGRHVKLHGVCLHHDLGALGAAYNKEANRRQLQLMKRMGVNAIRTSHNMPASHMMELCDEMGFLVDAEAFDMWEGAKTPYDYARFFKEWMPKDVASWIRRDRNHPSVIMWSMGNEIYDTHGSEHGMEEMLQIRDEVYRHDPLHNAPATIGSNYIPWEPTQKCADKLKLIGYNYAERLYAEHHEKHPDWMIYGSETASMVMSRGIYHFPASENILADDDLQCSSLNNSTTSWGVKSIDYCVTCDRDTPFCAGQFLWTGTDYLGEPTPYHTKNSYFGMADTAGFEKDVYYVFKAAWDTDTTPFVHLWPYWDFNEGQLIDLFSVSNQKEMALFFNGQQIGRQKIDAKKDMHLYAHWQLPYHKGTVEVRAYDENGNETARDTHTSFGDAVQLKVEASKQVLTANGQDMVFLTITALDENGNTVENAVNRVQVRVDGAARLIGLDAGDSTDDDSFRADHRRMFSGKLLAMISALDVPGDITVTLTSPALKGCEVHLQAQDCSPEEKQGRGIIERVAPSPAVTEIPVRKIELSFPDGCRMTKDAPRIRVQAKLLPENNTYNKVVWRLVNDAGIDSTLAQIRADGNEAVICGQFDGRLRVRCMAENGMDHACIISQMELSCEGFGDVRLNPYTFLSFGLNDISGGSISAGNERGVATANTAESIVGFSAVDFGDYGSDEVEIPIFTLNGDRYDFEIYAGDPREGGECVCNAVYQKPSIWNVYQADTFRLNRRLQGIHPLCFVTHDKMHLKGFRFKEYKRAFSPLDGRDYVSVYGDDFTRDGTAVRNIGNNVVVDLGVLDFEDAARLNVTVKGHSPIPVNTVHIRFTAEDETVYSLPIEFTKTPSALEKTFPLTLPDRSFGKLKTQLVFLPGSKFDLEWIRFDKA